MPVTCTPTLVESKEKEKPNSINNVRQNKSSECKQVLHILCPRYSFLGTNVEDWTNREINQEDLKWKFLLFGDAATEVQILRLHWRQDERVEVGEKWSWWAERSSVCFIEIPTARRLVKWVPGPRQKSSHHNKCIIGMKLTQWAVVSFKLSELLSSCWPHLKCFS